MKKTIHTLCAGVFALLTIIGCSTTFAKVQNLLPDP